MHQQHTRINWSVRDLPEAALAPVCRLARLDLGNGLGLRSFRPNYSPAGFGDGDWLLPRSTTPVVTTEKAAHDDFSNRAVPI
jgi:hypothetical protein